MLFCYLLSRLGNVEVDVVILIHELLTKKRETQREGEKSIKLV